MGDAAVRDSQAPGARRSRDRRGHGAASGGSHRRFAVDDNHHRPSDLHDHHLEFHNDLDDFARTRSFLLDYVHLDDDLDIHLHHNYDDAASPLGSTSVLPPTGRISVELVVANAGNAQIANIWAAASVVPNSSTVASGGQGASTRSSVLRVGRLAPGASIVVTLPALAVSTGRSYTLWASVGTGSLPQGPVTTPPGGLGQADEVNIKVASG